MKRYYYNIILFLTLMLCTGSAGAQEVRDSVRILFRQGKADLDVTLGGNREALNRIADSLTVRRSDSVYRLKNVLVIGGASPEGSAALNERLSRKRANVLFGHLSQYGTLPASARNFTYIGSDWLGLLRLVLADDRVPYRTEVVSLLHDIIADTKAGSKQPHNHLARLMNLRLGEPYRYMYSKLFPELRASRMILSYDKVWSPARMEPVVQRPDSLPPVPVKEKETVVPQDTVQTDTALLPKALKPFFMSVKTNALMDALLVPNLGAEFYLGKGYSVSANWHYAWWNTAGWFWRTYGGEAAVRKWLGKVAKAKQLSGHHLGMYGQILTYDFLAFGSKGYMSGGPGDRLADNPSYAVGVEYGYSHPIARRLNIDFVLGVGYQGGTYNEYRRMDNCYVWQAYKKRQFFGPTKAEVSLVWLIGRGNHNPQKGGGR